MPGVKRTRRESGDQPEAGRIHGHMLGAVGAVVECARGGRPCVPLGAEPRDGMRATASWEGSPFSKESHTARAAGPAFRCARELGPRCLLPGRRFPTSPALGRLAEPDAAEAAGKADGEGGAGPLVHVATGARSNCAACERPPGRAPGTPGRPRVRGAAVKPGPPFGEADAFSGAEVRIGDERREARLRSVEPLWGEDLRPPRFVLAGRGGSRAIPATTDLGATPEQVAEPCGARFGIEHMFRSLKQDVGAFGYRFRGGGRPELGRYARKGDPDRLEGVVDPADREGILACAAARALFVAAALVAQGAPRVVASGLDPLGEAGLVEFRRTRRGMRTTPRTARRAARKRVLAHIAAAPGGTIGAFIRGNLVGPGGYRPRKRGGRGRRRPR